MALGDWLRKKVEQWLDRYYAGPEMPERYVEAVIAFANEHPRATVQDWVDFSTAWAKTTWRAGYIQGFEHDAREPYEPPAVDPEVIADAYDPNWRWRPGIVLEGNRYRVVSAEEFPDELPDPDDRFARMYEDLQRQRPGTKRDDF